MDKPITFTYLNHRGEFSRRTVLVDSLEFQNNPGLGYQSGWFLSGICQDREARRSFALSRIVFDKPCNGMVNFRIPLRGVEK